jgi:hypothetical protein
LSPFKSREDSTIYGQLLSLRLDQNPPLNAEEIVMAIPRVFINVNSPNQPYLLVLITVFRIAFDGWTR